MGRARSKANIKAPTTALRATAKSRRALCRTLSKQKDDTMIKKLLIITAFIFCIPGIASSKTTDGYVAIVNYSDIKEALISLVSQKPEYSEIMKKYRKEKEESDKAFSEMQNQLQKGKHSLEEMSTKFAAHFMSKGFSCNTEIDDILKRELLHIIDDLYHDKYRLIIDSLNNDKILYNKTIIPDITSNVYEEILRKTNNNINN